MDITLLHYLCESDNQNIILFENATQRDTYFAGISDKITIQNINFFANDIMQTKVYVRVDNLSLFQLLNYNYAIVTNSTGETQQNPLFFRIINSRQDSGGQIELSLECDIANTYFYDLDFEKMQGIVERTHLDRIIQPNPENDFYVYDYGENSKLYERERVKNCSKRVMQRKPLYFEIDKTYNSAFNYWLRENISCWKYYFIALSDENGAYTFNHTYYVNYSSGHLDGIVPTQLYYVTEPRKTLTEENTTTQSNFLVICCPVYKNSQRGMTPKNILKVEQQYLDDNNQTQTVTKFLTETAIENWLADNNEYARVLAIKYSILPPFLQECELTAGTDFSIDTDNNMTLKFSITDTPKFFKTMSNLYYARNTSNNTPTIEQVIPFIHIMHQYLYEDYKLKCNLNITSTGIKWTFNKAEIQADYVEPKLWNEDYSTYRLIIGGQTYDMPISKTSNEPHFIYSEILSPDITKAQLSYDVENSNLVSENYFAQVLKEHSMRDFTGLTLTIDLSMWYPQNDLQNYLASNKNYLQIFQNQTIQKMSAGFKPAIETQTGNITGISAQAITKNVVDLFYNFDNLDLTLDNMANAPEKIASINSNAMLITAVQKQLSIFIEVLEMLPFEKQTMIDYFKQFGYTYNRLSNIADVMRTRKYYNYIQANIFEIEDKIGNNVKEKIKQMFANGIRFWHYDNFDGVDFTKNNYERFIDNE